MNLRSPRSLLLLLGLAAVAWSQFSVMSPIHDWFGRTLDTSISHYQRYKAVPQCSDLELTQLVSLENVQVFYPACFQLQESAPLHDGLTIGDSNSSVEPVLLTVRKLERPEQRQRLTDNWPNPRGRRYRSSINGWDVYASEVRLRSSGGPFVSYGFDLVGDRAVVMMRAAIPGYLLGTEIAEVQVGLVEEMARRVCEANPGVSVSQETRLPDSTSLVKKAI